MADQKDKRPQTQHQDHDVLAVPNGAWPENNGEPMPPKRAPRKRLPVKEPAVDHPVFDWRLLMGGNQLGLLAFIISAVTALYSAGWIPGIAKQTDVSVLAQQIVEIKTGVDRVNKEFSETRLEIMKTVSAIARIEGRMEAQAQIRVVRRAPPEPPKPVKAKGLFD